MASMPGPLSSVLFPGYRRRVLAMLHPEDSLHGREIARRAGLPAGTLTREAHRKTMQVKRRSALDELVKASEEAAGYDL
jgi:hypothetical protein